jgi:hypothetical protein
MSGKHAENADCIFLKIFLEQGIDLLHKIEYNCYSNKGNIVIKPLLNLAFSSPSARQGLFYTSPAGGSLDIRADQQ